MHHEHFTQCAHIAEKFFLLFVYWSLWCVRIVSKCWMLYMLKWRLNRLKLIEILWKYARSGMNNEQTRKRKKVLLESFRYEWDLNAGPCRMFAMTTSYKCNKWKNRSAYGFSVLFTHLYSIICCQPILLELHFRKICIFSSSAHRSQLFIGDEYKYIKKMECSFVIIDSK